jgi:hypothetical protein
MKLAVILLLVSALCGTMFFACGVGGEDPDDNHNNNNTSDTLHFPLGDSTSWTYSCIETEPDTTYNLTKTISGTATFAPDTLGSVTPPLADGISWIREYDKDSSYFYDDGDYIWFGAVDPTMVAYHAHPFVPLRVVPLKFTVGDSFRTNVHKQIGFLSADISFFGQLTKIENVTTPAGTFNRCARLEAILIVDSSIGLDSTYSTIWFADSIGVVKRDDYRESRSLHTYQEELISYDVVF